MLTRKQHVDYRLHGASENMKDMRETIKSKRRAMAMFCGHLVIEKMLKYGATTNYSFLPTMPD
jgi:hypothetical protein